MALFAGSVLYLGYLFSVQGSALSSPETTAQGAAGYFEVSIADDGRIRDPEGEELKIDQFGDTMWALFEADSNLQLKIRADKHVRYKDLEAIMEASAETGCVDIIFDAEMCGSSQEFWIELPSYICVDLVELPVEAWVEIDADGTVIIDGLRFDNGDVRLADLVHHLRGMKYVAGSQSAQFYVGLRPSAEAVYGRVLDVMGACAAADVEYFALYKSIDGEQ